jgi:hypothetical protein
MVADVSLGIRTPLTSLLLLANPYGLDVKVWQCGVFEMTGTVSVQIQVIEAVFVIIGQGIGNVVITANLNHIF